MDITKLSVEEIKKLSVEEIKGMLTYAQIQEVNNKVDEAIFNDKHNDRYVLGVPAMTPEYEQKERDDYFKYYAARGLKGLALGGNKKNKPKIYKNKIIQGKERNIYKIPGSRKDYIKYKGAFIAVNDYIKSKNK